MMKISDSSADQDSEIAVPVEYIRSKMFWEHFKANSYESYISIPYIEYARHLKYSEAEAHGRKRAEQKMKK
jgi:hypothetical protein